ncbi:FecR domain-containing protein [Porticoccaceae bacterium]|nr:FecR domain-containing protein [Porticoccaceae bacterium]
MDNSKVSEFSAKATIKQEAGAWIVKIDQGQLSPQQATALRQWMGKSDFHRSYLEKLAHNWDSMSVLQQLADLFPLQTASHTSVNSGQPSMLQQLKNWLANLHNSAKWGSAFASFVLVAMLITSQQGHHFETAIGQQASYQLPDGTTVSLNTNSALKIDYSQNRRHVHLIRGEAHFDVAKNPQRPFMVHAGQGMVWAVGTAFNVRYIRAVNANGALSSSSSDQYIDVTVTEGTVKIFADLEPTDSPSQKTVLSTSPGLPSSPVQELLVAAGKSAQYSDVITATQQTPALELEQKLAWQQGALIFKGETLEQAIAEIARYTDKQLVIRDPAIKTIRVGGHYKTDDINALLASISESLGIKLESSGTSVYLSAI